MFPSADSQGYINPNYGNEQARMSFSPSLSAEMTRNSNQLRVFGGGSMQMQPSRIRGCSPVCNDPDFDGSRWRINLSLSSSRTSFFGDAP
jgi:hypothetical protein